MTGMLDRYRLEQEIGRGGMGVVYRAYDLVLHRPVAIKILTEEIDDRSRALLLAEARAAAALNHPNICVVHEVHDAPRQSCLVLEYVDGQPLDALIPASGLPAASVVRYALQITDALAHAHRRQLVHGDVKPRNVLVSASGLVKLLDFGLARQLTRGEYDATTVTMTRPAAIRVGDIAGTPAYMAPEQLRGEPPDACSDVWSVGVMLFEMLAGHRPFSGRTFADLAAAVMYQPPPPLPSGRPEALAAIVERCLERDPARRFPTAAEVHAELDKLTSSASPSGRRRAVAGTPSVAVLPFVDMSPGRDQGYLCEGIAEEIINTLARKRDLRVVSRTSSFAIASTVSRAPEIDVREIGRRLNVATVVEGSVRKAADRLRVTAQLVDAATGYHVWSENFDRAAEDVFAVQDEIASAISSTFDRAHSPDDDEKPAVPARNVQAYELYLQGRYLWNRRPGDVVWRALKCFEEAVALDPHFAPAWAGMADVYSTLGSWESGVLPHGEAQAKARVYSQRALAIDGSLSEAYTTLAYTTLHYDWDFTQAEAGFLQALQLNGNYAAAHHWYSHCLAASGRVDESLEQSRAALQCDPMNLLLNVHLAWHYHMARKPEQVVEQADRVVHMDGSFHWGHYFLGWGFEGTGEPARAVNAFRAALNCSGENAVMKAGLGRALALSGDRKEGLSIAADLERAGGDHRLFAYEIALIHLALGDADAALDWLERAWQQRSGWIAYARVDPRLDGIRADARFRQILRGGAPV